MPSPVRILGVALIALLLCACDDRQAAQPEPGASLPTPTATLPAQPTNPQPTGVRPTKTAPPALAVPQGRGFDFYVLSLSWSPSYCEAEGASANRQQCESGRPYAFVVHGLWPQFDRGFPSDCDTSEPDVASGTLKSLYDIMPAAGLIRHEWREHGSCSGLSQADYFKVLRQARERVVIPQEFRRLDNYRSLPPEAAEQAFVNANAGLDAGELAVTCDKRYLREIRICMDMRLGFRSCPEIDRRACRMSTVVMPPLRGG